MLQIQERGVVDPDIPNFTLTPDSFNYLKVFQKSDLIIPTYELSIKTPNKSIINHIKKNNTKLKIKIGSSVKDVKEYDFLINNYSLSFSGEIHNIILTGRLDMTDFYTKMEQKVYNNQTTDTILYQLSNIDADVDYIGNDSQIWLKHNITEKEWVERLLKNHYISDDTFALGAYTIDKKLIVRDVLKELSKEPFIKFYNQPQGQSSSKIRYDSMRIESDYALPQAILGGGRKLSVYNMITNEESFMVADGKSFKASIDELTVNRQIPTLFDTYNVYDKFYTSELHTISKKLNLFSTNVILTISNNYLNDERLPLLKNVRLITNDTGDTLDDTFTGNYLVTEKNLYIDTKSMTQQITLNRGY